MAQPQVKRAVEELWPEGDLSVMLYSDGRDHMLLIGPPESGHIPPPRIGGLIYRGEYRSG